MPRPRVLYVCYNTPWEARYGGSIRNAGIIRGLAKLADLHVALASSEPGDIGKWWSGALLPRDRLHILAPAAGDSGGDDWSASRTAMAALGRGRFGPAFRSLVEGLAPDLVWYFEGEAVRRAGYPPGLPFVVDYCDLHWRNTLRMARRERGRGRYVGAAKAALSLGFDVGLALRARAVTGANADEALFLRRMGRFVELPNGYDFPPTPPSGGAVEPRIVFFGSLFYHPNQDGLRWFRDQVWPLVRQRRPDAGLDIIGLYDGAEPLVAREEGIRYHGYVEDLAPYLRRSACLVVPLRIGGGTRIKILEAWANGLPVVSTTIGAEGLGAVDGATLLIGDTPEDFAARCLTLIEDPAIGRRLAAGGYAHGRARFDWAAVESVLGGVLAAAGDPRGDRSWRGLA